MICNICLKFVIFFYLFQQCELYHWVDLLDRFDGILCDAGQTVENMSWLLVCDRPENGQLKALLLAVLNFTALLIEYSFSRHLYSSIEVWFNQLSSSVLLIHIYVFFCVCCGYVRENEVHKLKYFLFYLPSTPFTAPDHLVSIMWHAGGPVCAEPTLCVQ